MTDIARYDSGLDVMQLGNVLSKSGYFSDAREASQAVVKVLAGQELGIPPIAAMTGIHIIKGRVTLGANLMAAVIKRSGRYTYKIARLDNDMCVLSFYEAGEHVGDSGFSMDDAKAAGVISNQTWKAYPRNMLFARALSNGARWYCPDLFGGSAVYTSEELQGGGFDGEYQVQEVPAATYTSPPNGNGHTAPVVREDGAICIPSQLDEYPAGTPLLELSVFLLQNLAGLVESNKGAKSEVIRNEALRLVNRHDAISEIVAMCKQLPDSDVVAAWNDMFKSGGPGDEERLSDDSLKEWGLRIKALVEAQQPAPEEQDA